MFHPGGGKKITKVITIKMTERVHYDLRLMAAASDKTMGELIGDLVQGLRGRLERYRQEYGIKESYTHRDAIILSLILKMDSGVLEEEEFRDQMKDIRDEQGGPRPGEGRKKKHGESRRTEDKP